MNYKDQLRELRNKVPVGLQHGLRLLEKTNGDVEQAAILFNEEMLAAKEAMLSVILEATGVSKEMAELHLVKKEFNVEAAIESVRDALLSETERILKKIKDKKEVLESVAAAVERANELTRSCYNDNSSSGFAFLHLPQLSKLAPELSCLMILAEWFEYEEYEGFSYAINFHTEEVAKEIENQLKLTELAATLRKAKDIHKQQREEQWKKLKRDGFARETPEFEEQRKRFEELRPLLIDTLYDLIKQNLDKFP